MHATHWLALAIHRAVDDAPAPDAPNAPPVDDTPPPTAAPTVFVASTAAVDRMRDIVEQDWLLDDYRKNPVVLWAHRYDDPPPIGRAIGVEVRDGRLLLSVEWNSESKDPRVQAIIADVKAGYLNAVSVGFRPGEEIPRRSLPDGDPRKAEYGYILRRNELLEVSVVSVPANAEALVLSRSAAPSATMIADCVRRGLPAPGPDGAIYDAVIRAAREAAKAEADASLAATVERLLGDADFVARLADHVGAKIAPPPPEAQDAAAFFAAVERSPSDEWARFWRTPTE